MDFALLLAKCLSRQNTILYHIYYPGVFHGRILYYTSDMWELTCDNWHVTIEFFFFPIGATILTLQEIQYPWYEGFFTESALGQFSLWIAMSVWMYVVPSPCNIFKGLLSYSSSFFLSFYLRFSFSLFSYSKLFTSLNYETQCLWSLIMENTDISKK